MNRTILSVIEKGHIVCTNKKENVKELPWHDHPAFPGVALKHLITGTSTDGKFSSHLVRIQDGCEIGEHIHKGKWELHEVVTGQGSCIVNGAEIAYWEGVSTVIPSDFPHIVKAKNGDLYLLAKFIPALI